jgi:hypothetical protein
MRRRSKLALAVGAVLPATTLVAIAGFMAYRIIAHELTTTGQLSGSPLSTLFGSVFSTSEWLAVGFAVLSIAFLELLLAIPFAIHAARLPGATTLFVALWIAAFVFVGMLAFPVYWLFYVLPDRAQRPALPSMQVGPGTNAWA